MPTRAAEEPSQPLSLQGFRLWLLSWGWKEQIQAHRGKGAQGAAPSTGDTKIRALLLKLLSASDTVLPLSKKINIQTGFSKVNNPSSFSALRLTHQGTGRAVLCSHSTFPSHRLSLVCSSQHSCL